MRSKKTDASAILTTSLTIHTLASNLLTELLQRSPFTHSLDGGESDRLPREFRNVDQLSPLFSQCRHILPHSSTSLLLQIAQQAKGTPERARPPPPAFRDVQRCANTPTLS